MKNIIDKLLGWALLYKKSNKVPKVRPANSPTERNTIRDYNFCIANFTLNCPNGGRRPRWRMWLVEKWGRFWMIHVSGKENIYNRCHSLVKMLLLYSTMLAVSATGDVALITRLNSLSELRIPSGLQMPLRFLIHFSYAIAQDTFARKYSTSTGNPLMEHTFCMTTPSSYYSCSSCFLHFNFLARYSQPNRWIILQFWTIHRLPDPV